MKTKIDRIAYLCICLALIGVLPTCAEELRVEFRSEKALPIYRVSDQYLRSPVQPGQRLSAGDLVYTKMELLVLAPASLSLAEGKYLLNVGGVEDTSRNFILDLEGSDKTVIISGDSAQARTFAYLTAISSALLIASIPGCLSDTQTFGAGRILTAGAASLTLGFGIAWNARSLRVKIVDGIR